jgi:uncharacterized membrane protein YeaQ/YmgE (transglycosylase-associated protein family)
MEGLLWFLLIGAAAGWLAGLLMKGRGFGVIGNILVGVVGSVLGGWLFRALNFWPGGGLVGALFTAFAGAVVLLFVISLIRRA